MEEVVRICELTGRKVTIAENLTTEQAIQLVREKMAEGDPFNTYTRIVPREY